MIECNQLIHLQLSTNPNDHICFGGVVRNSIIGTLWPMLSFFGVSVLSFVSLLIKPLRKKGRKAIQKAFAYTIRLCKRVFRKETTINKHEEEERKYRHSYLSGKTNSHAFGREMLYRDLFIISDYEKGKLSTEETVTWYIKHRWERFRDNIEEYQDKKGFMNMNRGEKHTYRSWFERYNNDKYPRAEISRKDERTETKILTYLSESANKSEDEVRRKIREILLEELT